jgi:hypothetical protein
MIDSGGGAGMKASVRSPIIVFIFLVMFLSPTAETAGEQLTIEQHDFPIGPEIRWKYEITLAADPARVQEYEHHFIECSTCEESDGICIRTSPGKIAWYSSKEAELPVRSIHFPLRAGSSWKEAVECGEGGKQVKTLQATVVGEETVTVPAGMFRTLKFVEHIAGFESTATYWIAPGVGMVQQQIAQPVGTNRISLIDYSLSE